ncbi:MAG: hypothetical protein H3C39_08610 [Flavobacteriia bacterium]|nr:hypothetical protein [Flavobacteriia bacterium]
MRKRGYTILILILLASSCYRNSKKEEKTEKEFTSLDVEIKNFTFLSINDSLKMDNKLKIEKALKEKGLFEGYNNEEIIFRIPSKSKEGSDILLIDKVLFLYFKNEVLFGIYTYNNPATETVEYNILILDFKNSQYYNELLEGKFNEVGNIISVGFLDESYELNVLIKYKYFNENTERFVQYYYDTAKMTNIVWNP